MTLSPFDEYRKLEAELFRIRGRHRGEDSAEEEAHLEQMDIVGALLSVAERMRITEERSMPQTVREMREEDILEPLIDTNIWIDAPVERAARIRRRVVCI
jgi:hypothetical protein